MSIRRGLLALTLALGAIFAIGSLARELDLPNEEVWLDNASIVNPWLFAFGVFAAVGGPIGSLLLEGALRQSEERRYVQNLTHQIAITIPTISALTDREIAVHVWMVPHARIAPSRGKLTRIASFRLEKRRDAPVHWSYGHGVIGRCWATGEEFTADLTTMHKAAARGRDTFMALPEAERFGLDWAEYENTSRYWSIFVTPLLKDRRIVGCLSVDCSAEGSAATLDAACRSTQITGLISVVQEVVNDF